MRALLRLLCIASALTVSTLFQAAIAAELSLAWQASSTSDSIQYRLYIGPSSGNYSQTIDVGQRTQFTLTGLQPGEHYFFNLKAIDNTSNLESAFAGEIDRAVPHVAPTPNFGADTVSGDAPLLVRFNDLSSGVINERRWDFGNGATGSAETSLISYQEPGVYTVRLTVSGPGGSRTLTQQSYIVVTAPEPEPEPAVTVTPPEPSQPQTNSTDSEPPLVVGELLLSERWQRVWFTREFIDPVVIAGPAASLGAHAALVQIRNVDQDGFEVRARHWGSQNNEIDTEAGYIVVERGRHTLANGASLEAGLAISRPNARQGRVQYSAPFRTQPVLLTAVIHDGDSVDDEVPQTARLRGVSSLGFLLRLQAPEAYPKNRAAAQVAYIALEPSAGLIGDWLYEAERTPEPLRENFVEQYFLEDHGSPPALFAAQQTSNGDDPAVLSWQNKSVFGVELRVAEERSLDSETLHAPESIGYLLLSPLE